MSGTKTINLAKCILEGIVVDFEALGKNHKLLPIDIDRIIETMNSSSNQNISKRTNFPAYGFKERDSLFKLSLNLSNEVPRSLEEFVKKNIVEELTLNMFTHYLRVKNNGNTSKFNQYISYIDGIVKNNDLILDFANTGNPLTNNEGDFDIKNLDQILIRFYAADYLDMLKLNVDGSYDDEIQRIEQLIEEKRPEIIEKKIQKDFTRKIKFKEDTEKRTLDFIERLNITNEVENEYLERKNTKLWDMDEETKIREVSSLLAPSEKGSFGYYFIYQTMNQLEGMMEIEYNFRKKNGQIICDKLHCQNSKDPKERYHDIFYREVPNKINQKILDNRTQFHVHFFIPLSSLYNFDKTLRESTRLSVQDIENFVLGDEE